MSVIDMRCCNGVFWLRIASTKAEIVDTMWLHVVKLGSNRLNVSQHLCSASTHSV